MKEYHFEKIDSTSNYLKNNYEIFENMTFVSSDFQTNGHGRYNRVWESKDKENLLFSILIKDKDLISKYSSLSIFSAVVIYNVLRDLNVKNISIKWPNDVYVNDKKISGILLESVSFSGQIFALVIGVGINVNSSSFSDELKDKVTSVSLELGNTISINDFKQKIYNEFLVMFEGIKKDSNYYLDIVRSNNYLKDKEVYANIENQKVLVKVIDINDDNTLKVSVGKKEYNLYSSEITFNL